MVLLRKGTDWHRAEMPGTALQGQGKAEKAMKGKATERQRLAVMSSGLETKRKVAQRRRTAWLSEAKVQRRQGMLSLECQRIATAEIGIDKRSNGVAKLLSRQCVVY